MQNKRNLVVLVVIAFVVIVGGVLALSMRKAPQTNSNNTASQTSMSHEQMSSGSSGSSPTATDTVTIENYAFSPESITVKVGTKVTWTNKDSVGHTVTADKPSADAPNSDVFMQGKSYSFTFTKAGTYNYHCTPHPYMKATVTVTE